MQDLTIVSTTANNDFSIDIQLNNGKTFLFDMKSYLQYPAFKKMQQLSFFKQFKHRG